MDRPDGVWLSFRVTPEFFSSDVQAYWFAVPHHPRQGPNCSVQAENQLMVPI